MQRAFLIVLSVSLLAGCADLQQASQDQQRVQLAFGATTQAVTDLKARVDALPASDPDRAVLQAKLDKLEALEPKIQQALDASAALIAGLHNGTLTSPAVQSGAAMIPGGWGLVGLLAAQMAFSAYNAVKQSRNHQSLVSVVGEALTAIGTSAASAKT